MPFHIYSGGREHTLCWRRLEQSRMAPRVSFSRLASNPTLKHTGHLGVAALLFSRCNLPGTELALHVEAAFPVCGGGGGRASLYHG